MFAVFDIRFFPVDIPVEDDIRPTGPGVDVTIVGRSLKDMMLSVLAYEVGDKYKCWWFCKKQAVTTQWRVDNKVSKLF